MRRTSSGIVTCIFVVTVVIVLAINLSIPDRLVRLKRLEIPLAIQSDKMGFPSKKSKRVTKGSVLDIVLSPPSFLRRYTRWFR
jgi:hypothetical protein